MTKTALPLSKNTPLAYSQASSSRQRQAFARAYRPQNFAEVVGQEHVLKALTYSLDYNNLHHAYLLTGTRGVGKTTLGRIFAKALNCEQGISATPCGVCSACESIAAGRFVDLIEVDGASNTKVEDTRELLEDVQFVPTQGRFKVYLIDEVHMLSNHSFNALLKTLEEPPEHVKFILATTDPQKLPVTVLSRCLQFHLQLLSVPLIQQHIQQILTQEQIPFEPRATYLLAEAAQGSMRDALTLADQARSQGQGQINTDSVTQMLGILDQRLAHQLLKAVAEGSPADVLSTFTQVETSGADSDQILKDLIELCHQVALAQALGEQQTTSLFSDPSLCESIITLAMITSPAQIQLCYETLLSARKNLPYTGSPAVAVRMALLRMTCFQNFASDALEHAEEHTEKKKHSQRPALSSAPATVTPAMLEDANNWLHFLKQASSGGLFGQLLYNSRLTQVQQNTSGWRAHLIVSDQIFSYAAAETNKQTKLMLEHYFKTEFDISSSQVAVIEAAPAVLRDQEKQQALAAFKTRLDATEFIGALKAHLAVTIEICAAEEL